jgi:signal transduction protein with GAF and PtsI domain
VDRMDPRVAPLYEPLHPAVLRALKRIADAAASTGRPLSVCGEMAADPLHALLLLGLGVRELSMSPAAIPRIKAVVRSATVASARAAAEASLEMATSAEIEEHLRRALGIAAGAGVVVPS